MVGRTEWDWEGGCDGIDVGTELGLCVGIEDGFPLIVGRIEWDREGGCDGLHVGKELGPPV